MTAPEQTPDRWSVRIDPHACVGSGMCIATAPERFRLDGSRAAAVDAGPVEPDEILLDAAEACPAEAISVHDAATDELLAPRPF